MKYFLTILCFLSFVLSSNKLLAQEKFISEKHTIYDDTKEKIIYENILFEIDGETLTSSVNSELAKSQKHLLGTVEEGEYSITWKFISGINLDGEKGTFVLIKTIRSNNSDFRESIIYNLKTDTILQ